MTALAPSLVPADNPPQRVVHDVAFLPDRKVDARRVAAGELVAPERSCLRFRQRGGADDRAPAVEAMGADALVAPSDRSGPAAHVPSQPGQSPFHAQRPQAQVCTIPFHGQSSSGPNVAYRWLISQASF